MKKYAVRYYNPDFIRKGKKSKGKTYDIEVNANDAVTARLEARIEIENKGVKHYAIIWIREAAGEAEERRETA